MKYREPARRARIELETDLESGSVDLIAGALVDAAHHNDPGWVLEALLGAADDERLDVARAALLGFSILARRGELRSDRRVWDVLLRAVGDERLGGTANDVLEDLELCGTVGRLVNDEERPCCAELAPFIDDPATPFGYNPIVREWGLVVLNFEPEETPIWSDIPARQLIDYCPLCSAQLPASLRLVWFETLERLGLDAGDDDLPAEFRSDRWWKERGL